MRTNQTPRQPLFSQPHVCGCYFLNPDRNRVYLPQVSLKSHSSINAQCFATSLTQTFCNTDDREIAKARYAFPLYDGVTVSGYTISYAGKVLNGIVKQKDEAKTIYQTAVDRGETAGLLEALPAGVFGVSLGNIPPRASITVEITYCGELKHDAAVDGLRYTLPTSIAPRYGTYPGSVLESHAVAPSGISIIVDIDTADSPVRRIQSPSHPIAVSMGELSRVAEERNEPAQYTPSKASATLSLASTELEDDFVLQMVIDGIGSPQAIIETHPTISNHRTIMTTLVPRFSLNSGFPEIIFVADQSGSMQGGNNEALKAALRIFLKSLPLGVRFNICAFGSHHEFLWPKSQAYNEPNLDTAMSFVESFEAGYGGTEILQPVTAAFENRLGDLPLELMLLTDGKIWAEADLFSYINKKIHEEKVDSRVFTLGIGSRVSHTLVEGVARAGNGFAQFVTDKHEGSESSSDIDQKIIRMLKAALFAHTKDYKLEIHYDDVDSMRDDEDFELVERVSDCLCLNDTETVTKASSTDGEPEQSKPKTFFDPSADLDEPANPSATPADRYSHLPSIETPRILQTPTTIPPLFPFNRTTVYLILGPESPQQAVRSVTLRATSAEGPLELNIPVKAIGTGSTIHQLAAHKAIQDLEEGRGWLNVATVGAGKDSAKGKFASRFDELVEREAVRIGVKFQVAGKWTSFVAVEQGPENVQASKSPEVQLTAPEPRRQMAAAYSLPNVSHLAATRDLSLDRSLNITAACFGSASTASSTASDTGGGRFDVTSGGALLSHGGESQNRSKYRMSPTTTVAEQRMLVRPNVSAASSRVFADEDDDPSDTTGGSDVIEASQRQLQAGTKKGFRKRRLVSAMDRKAEKASETDDPIEQMRHLVRLQSFSGAWAWDPQLFQVLGLEESRVDRNAFPGEAHIAATVLAITFLQTRAKEQAGAWELVVDKARTWLSSVHGIDEQEIQRLITIACGYY